MASAVPNEEPINRMYPVGIYTDHETYDSAQVILKLERTGERLAISLFKTSTAEDFDDKEMDPTELPVVDRCIRLLAQTMFIDDYDEQQDVEEEALGPVYDTVDALLSESATHASGAPNHSSQSQNQSLHQLLYPKTSHYRFEVTTEGPVLVSISADEAYGEDLENDETMRDYQAEVDIDSSLPQYPSKQIQVISETVFGGGTVCLVEYDGRQMLCKARQDGLRSSNLEREIDCLQRIRRAFPGPARTVQVPPLLGYVVHPTSGVILGLLREWIPSKDSLRDLKQDGFPGTDKDIREKWAHQIKETVNHLHAIGVVWGDAKPDNIVIDLNGDAWLIDFGGGWTEGWVEKDLEETVEGDQVAVEKILRFLNMEACSITHHAWS